MKRFKMFVLMMAIMYSAIMYSAISAIAEPIQLKVATGGKGGFYHNGLFNTFNSCVKRVSDNKYVLVYSNPEGTDGTLKNIKLVESNNADIAFIQKCGLALTQPNVEMVGTLLYEVAHLVSLKDSKVDEMSDLQDKTVSVGINSKSGGAVTFAVFGKEDGDYLKPLKDDYTSLAPTINKMSQGKLDSIFFVTAPIVTNADLSRLIQSKMVFRDFDDGDFDDFKYNGTPLYHFITIGKKQGYPNNFTTIAIPAVVILNKDVQEKYSDLYDILFDAALMAKTKIQNDYKFDWYPEE